jgi:hypothetical protein
MGIGVGVDEVTAADGGRREGLAATVFDDVVVLIAGMMDSIIASCPMITSCSPTAPFTIMAS